MKDLIIGILIGLVITIAISSLVAWLVMLLWNSVICAIFDIPELNFWLAFGLCILISLLFGNGGNNKK